MSNIYDQVYEYVSINKEVTILRNRVKELNVLKNARESDILTYIEENSLPGVIFQGVLFEPKERKCKNGVRKYIKMNDKSKST